MRYICLSLNKASSFTLILIRKHNMQFTYTCLAAYIKENKSSAVAEMGDRGHNRHAPKRGGCCAPFAGEELGPCLTQCGLGRGLLPYQVASSSIQHLATIDMGRKLGGCAPFRGELRPHRTQRRVGRGLPPYQMAS